MGSRAGPNVTGKRPSLHRDLKPVQNKNAVLQPLCVQRNPNQRFRKHKKMWVLIPRKDTASLSQRLVGIEHYFERKKEHAVIALGVGRVRWGAFCVYKY